METSSGSNSYEKKSFWSGLWKLKVTGKVRHFMWKACSDSLPTKQNLNKWIILKEDVCQLCQHDSQQSETTLHVLWECEVIRPVWTNYFGYVNAVKASSGSNADLVSLIKTQPHLLDIFSVISWLLWNQRNKIRVVDSVHPMDSIILEAEIFLALHEKSRATRVKKIQRVKKKIGNHQMKIAIKQISMVLYLRRNGKLVLELWFVIIEVKLWPLSLKKYKNPPRCSLCKCWQKKEQSYLLKNLVLVSLLLKATWRLTLMPYREAI